jgi:hypothetical protein
VGRACRQEAGAVAAFIATYEPVLLTYLIYACRMPQDDARDALQAFMLDRIIDGELLTKADRRRGRLRSLLFTALNNYVDDIRRHERARMRQPEGGVPAPLDVLNANEIRTEARPDMFDRLWARQIIRLALEQARSELETAGQARYWALFEARVLQPVMHDHDPEPYADCVKRLRFRSPREASNALVTVKRRVRRAMETLISSYAGPGNFEDELTSLCDIVERSHHLVEELCRPNKEINR